MKRLSSPSLRSSIDSPSLASSEMRVAYAVLFGSFKTCDQPWYKRGKSSGMVALVMPATVVSDSLLALIIPLSFACIRRLIVKGTNAYAAAFPTEVSREKM